MAVQDRRLLERASESLRHSHQGRLILLAGATVIIVTNTLIDALAGFYLIQENLYLYRAWAAASLGLTAVINILLLVLMWVLFETMGRVERESDRVQRLADTTYRKLP